MTRRRDQRGMSISVELAILVPALVLIIGMLIGAGRLALARISVQQWADSSARTATLARDAHAAQARAHAVVASDAGGSGLHCAGGWQLSVDTSAFALPVGQPGSVRTTVRCPVALADLLLPGVPGTIVVEADATSTLDRYRGRG
ncbi:MAG TPA: pilus assembly protein [Propionibacterium sp.]|nr:pilus assembly protein [Propionibacterium sp.]